MKGKMREQFARHKSEAANPPGSPSEAVAQLADAIGTACQYRKMQDALVVERQLRGVYDCLLDVTVQGDAEKSKELMQGAQRSFWRLASDEVSKDYMLEPVYYLGHLNGIAELSRMISTRSIPFAAIGAVESSKYAPKVLAELSTQGSLDARELASSIELGQLNNLSRVTRPLVGNLLISRRRLGKNVVFSILPLGQAVIDRLDISDVGERAAGQKDRGTDDGQPMEWLECRLIEILDEHQSRTGELPGEAAEDIVTAMVKARPETWEALAEVLKERQLQRILAAPKEDPEDG